MLYNLPFPRISLYESLWKFVVHGRRERNKFVLGKNFILYIKV